MSWGGYSIFLTPVHDWIHDCIWDWTREWDPTFNMSAVSPNRRQGIIAMLSGGMAGWFRGLRLGNPKKVAKPRLAPKVAGLGFSTFPIFGGRRSDPLPYF